MRLCSCIPLKESLGRMLYKRFLGDTVLARLQSVISLEKPEKSSNALDRKFEKLPLLLGKTKRLNWQISCSASLGICSSYLLFLHRRVWRASRLALNHRKGTISYEDWCNFAKKWRTLSDRRTYVSLVQC